MSTKGTIKTSTKGTVGDGSNQNSLRNMDFTC